MYGGAGNDILKGGWGGDWFGGGTGNDVLNGGYGSDTYQFSRGDGQDIIQDNYTHQSSYTTWERQVVNIYTEKKLEQHQNNPLGGSMTVGNGNNPQAVHYVWKRVTKSTSSELDAGDRDELSFGPGIVGADLLMRLVDGDLEIALKPGAPAGDNDIVFDELADKVTIEDWADENRRVEVLRFNGGTEIAFRDLFDEMVLPSRAPPWPERALVDGGPALDLGEWMAARATGETVDIASLDEAGTDYDLTAGTNTGETISGTDGVDVMVARGGDDTLVGNAGADIIDGGEGEDTLTYLFSGSGVDVNLETGIGSDAPVTDTGDTTGSNTTGDVASNASLAAGDNIANVENVTGSFHDDVLVGDGRENRLAGAAGDDVLSGGDGNDRLDGGSGDDVLEGGVGSDTLIGGVGNDTASYANATEGVAFNLETGATSGTHAVGDTFSGIENLAGSAHDDTLTGNSGNNILTGNAGADHLVGGSGNDRLDGGTGNDSLAGAAGNDVYQFSRGSGMDTIHDDYSYEHTSSHRQNYTYHTWHYSGGGQNGGGGWRRHRHTGTRTVHTTETRTGDGGNDVLEFGGDIRLTDLLMRLTGGALVFALKPEPGAPAGNNDIVFDDLEDRVTIEDWADENHRVEEMHFSDGTRLNMAAALDAFAITEGGPAVDVGAVMATLGVEELGAIDGVIVTGTDSDDVLGGSDGNDVQIGGSGDDTLLGSSGSDTLVGGEGSDTVDYGTSSEAVIIDLATGEGKGGDADGDTLISIENLVGSTHDDTLRGNDDDNTLNGNAGDDTLEGRGGADHLAGGSGSDTASYESSDEGVSVNLQTGTGTGGDAEGDTLTGIENLDGSDHNDSLTGDSADNTLDGKAGVDRLEGAAGEDRIILGQGTDLLEGGEGNDTYVFNRGDGLNTIHDDHRYDAAYSYQESYTYGERYVRGYSGGGQDNPRRAVYGSRTRTGYRTITGTREVHENAGFDVLVFGSGIMQADLLIERDGYDLLIALRDPARPDATALELEASSLTDASGGAGDTVRITDWMDGKNRIERFQFEDGTQQDVRDIVGLFSTSDGDDTVTWEETAATMDGGEGNDHITTGGGADHLAGGDGNDTLVSGSHDDMLEGGAGDDVLNAGEGDDLLSGGRGNDILEGGAGDDTYVLGRGDDSDVIDNSGGLSADTDILTFGDEINTHQLWFARDGNDLSVSIIGTEDSALIRDWYGEPDNRIDSFITSAGAELAAADVERMVHAMAAFSPPTFGETELSQDLHDNLDETIAASWQMGSG